MSAALGSGGYSGAGSNSSNSNSMVAVRNPDTGAISYVNSGPVNYSSSGNASGATNLGTVYGKYSADDASSPGGSGFSSGNYGGSPTSGGNSGLGSGGYGNGPYAFAPGASSLEGGGKGSATRPPPGAAPSSSTSTPAGPVASWSPPMGGPRPSSGTSVSYRPSMPPRPRTPQWIVPASSGGDAAVMAAFNDTDAPSGAFGPRATRVPTYMNPANDGMLSPGIRPPKFQDRVPTEERFAVPQRQPLELDIPGGDLPVAPRPAPANPYGNRPPANGGALIDASFVGSGLFDGDARASMQDTLQNRERILGVENVPEMAPPITTSVDVPYTELAPPITTSIDVPYTEPAGSPPPPRGSNPQLIDKHKWDYKVMDNVTKRVPVIGKPFNWLMNKDIDRINQMTPEQQGAIQARWGSEQDAYMRGDIGDRQTSPGLELYPRQNAYTSAIGSAKGGPPPATGGGTPPPPPPASGIPARNRVGNPSDPLNYGYGPGFNYFTYTS